MSAKALVVSVSSAIEKAYTMLRQTEWCYSDFFARVYIQSWSKVSAHRAPKSVDPPYAPRAPKSAQEVLSCKPVFKFFKSDHNLGRYDQKTEALSFWLYLQNRPLKSGLEVIYTPSPQNPSGNRLFDDQNPEGA